MSAMEGRGFKLQNNYKSQLRGLCASLFWSENLNYCLDEMSRECLSSGSLIGYRGAYRKKDGFYNSVFIDSLESEFGYNCECGNADVGLQQTFVHPAVKEFDDQLLRFSHKKRVDFVNDIERLKEIEFQENALSLVPWSGKRSEFEAILRSCLLKCGFLIGRPAELCKVDVSKKWYYLDGGRDFQFSCAFDCGFSGKIFGQLPISFWVHYPNRLSSIPKVGSLDLNHVIPGLMYYGQFGRLSHYATDVTPDPAASLIVGIEAVAIAYAGLARSLYEV